MIHDKAILRKEKLALRRSLSKEQRRIFSEQISQNLLASSFYKEAQKIMLYYAMPDEVDLSVFARAAQMDKKIMFYPHCISDTEMLPLTPTQDRWGKGRFGILEPDPAFSETISPAELDLVICPCAAFDQKGNRLGMGAGYYDRFLEKCTSAHIISVAFEIQKTDLIPTEPWDLPMEMIYTEKTP